jgi:acyl carrier protein
VIESAFRARNILSSIGIDEDYFDRGVSSLTIIGLRIDVERALGVMIETRELMGFSTINQWIDAYDKKLSTISTQPLESEKNNASNHGQSV